MQKSFISDIFRIELFENSKHPDFIKALNIYSKFTPSNIKTDTNDIIFWLENYNKKFSDSFFVFGLYKNDKVIGFMQLVYFLKEKFFTVDYITIDENHRQMHAFTTFIYLVHSFFEINNYDVNFVVTEVEYDEKIKQPLESGRTLIRLLKQHNFSVVKVTYFQPQLGMHNHDSKTSAVLMYFSNNEKKYISKETYFMILNKLFYEHYCRWYEPLLTKDEFSEYKNEIDLLYNKIRSNKIKNEIQINGYKNIFNINYDKKNNSIQNTFVSSLIIFLLLFCLLLLNEYFNVGLFSIASLSILIVAIFFLIYSLYSNKGITQFDKIIKILRFFYK